MPTPKPSSYCVDCDGPCRETRLHGIPRSRVGSGSKMFSGNVVGKNLTDRRIAKYQAEGKYGTPLFKAPEKTGARCQKCNGTKEVKHRDWSYLPSPGYYCSVCVDQFRKVRDKERELAARIRAAMKEDYI